MKQHWRTYETTVETESLKDSGSAGLNSLSEDRIANFPYGLDSQIVATSSLYFDMAATA